MRKKKLIVMICFLVIVAVLIGVFPSGTMMVISIAACLAGAVVCCIMYRILFQCTIHSFYKEFLENEKYD